MLRPISIAAALAVGLLALPQPAWAGEARTQAQKASWPESLPPELENTPTTRWYGYQTLASDVVAFGTFAWGITNFKFCFALGSASTPDCDNALPTAMMLSGFGLYAVGAPTVHAVHGHWDKAGLSLGMRAAPFLAALLPDEFEYSGLVALSAYLAAVALDAAWLAHEEVPQKRTQWGFMADPMRKQMLLWGQVHF